MKEFLKVVAKESHNPYFNRWFSAIDFINNINTIVKKVTILILIDGFLQFIYHLFQKRSNIVTILILIDGFLQCKEVIDDNFNCPVTILILIDGFLQ